MQLHLQIYKKNIENAKKRIKNDNLYVIVCELIFDNFATDIILKIIIHLNINKLNFYDNEGTYRTDCCCLRSIC